MFIDVIIHIIIFSVTWAFTTLLINFITILKDPFLFENKPVFFMLMAIPISVILYIGIIITFLGG